MIVVAAMERLSQNLDVIIVSIVGPLKLWATFYKFLIP